MLFKYSYIFANRIKNLASNIKANMVSNIALRYSFKSSSIIDLSLCMSLSTRAPCFVVPNAPRGPTA